MPLQFTHVDWEAFPSNSPLLRISAMIFRFEIIFWGFSCHLGWSGRGRDGNMSAAFENWVNKCLWGASCPDQPSIVHFDRWKLFSVPRNKKKHSHFHYFPLISCWCEGKTQKSQTYVKHKRCHPLQVMNKHPHMLLSHSFACHNLNYSNELFSPSQRKELSKPYIILLKVFPFFSSPFFRFPFFGENKVFFSRFSISKKSSNGESERESDRVCIESEQNGMMEKFFVYKQSAVGMGGKIFCFLPFNKFPENSENCFQNFFLSKRKFAIFKVFNPLRSDVVKLKVCASVSGLLLMFCDLRWIRFLSSRNFKVCVVAGFFLFFCILDNYLWANY